MSIFDGVEAWKGAGLLPAGWHNVNIDTATGGTSSGKHPQIELEMSNQQGSRKDWLVVTALSLGKVVALANAAGIDTPGEDEYTLEGDDVRIGDSWIAKLVGKKVAIFVGEEDDRQNPGQKRLRIQGYMPVKESDVTPAGYGSDFVTSPSASDDDIPF